MEWTNAIDTLRRFLGDGPTDKSFWRQKMLGEANGTNKEFKIFNTRVVVVVSPATPVFHVNGTVATGAVTDAIQSIVTLTTAPINGDTVEATGYFQYWLDGDMEEFLKRASEQIIEGENYENIQEGLRAAAQHLAASCAYNNLASRFTENRSSQYQLSERGEKGKDMVAGFIDLAKWHQKEGLAKRDEFYKRLGRRAEPAFGTALTHAPSYQPKR